MTSMPSYLVTVSQAREMLPTATLYKHRKLNQVPTVWAEDHFLTKRNLICLSWYVSNTLNDCVQECSLGHILKDCTLYIHHKTTIIMYLYHSGKAQIFAISPRNVKR